MDDKLFHVVAYLRGFIHVSEYRDDVILICWSMKLKY